MRWYSIWQSVLAWFRAPGAVTGRRRTERHPVRRQVDQRIRAIYRPLDTLEEQEAQLFRNGEARLIRALELLGRALPAAGGFEPRGERLSRTLMEFLEEPRGQLARALAIWPASTDAARRALAVSLNEVDRLVDEAEAFVRVVVARQRARAVLDDIRDEYASDQPSQWQRLVIDPELEEDIERANTPHAARAVVARVAFARRMLKRRRSELQAVELRIGEQVNGLDPAAAPSARQTSLEERADSLMAALNRASRESHMRTIHRVNDVSLEHLRAMRQMIRKSDWPIEGATQTVIRRAAARTARLRAAGKEARKPDV